MDEQCLEIIKIIEESLQKVLDGKSYTTVPLKGLPTELLPIIEKINIINDNINDMNRCVFEMAKGNISIAMPKTDNHISDSVRELQKSLIHLNWQTQQVASGDYNRVNDFMGDFSVSFNEMVVKLRERESFLNAQNDIFSAIFDHIESLFIVEHKNRNEAFFINKMARKTFNINSNTFNLSEVVEKSGFLKQLFSMETADEKIQQELFDTDTGQWYSIFISNLCWIDGRDAVLIYMMNITHHKQLQIKLEQESRTDALTGVLNRRMLENQMHSDWELYKASLRPIAVLMIDIDFFKVYNDTYGHLQGDVCLKYVANTLVNMTKNCDSMVVRFGGEEFVVMLPGYDAIKAITLADKIRIAVQDMDIPSHDGSPGTTKTKISIGVASLIPTNEIKPEDLLHLADEALYRAKKTGRNKISM